MLVPTAIRLPRRRGSPSASWGIISNVRRRAPGPAREEERAKTLHHYGTLIQTDARLNLGCSGGALIDLRGVHLVPIGAKPAFAADKPTKKESPAELAK